MSFTEREKIERRDKMKDLGEDLQEMSSRMESPRRNNCHYKEYAEDFDEDNELRWRTYRHKKPRYDISRLTSQSMMVDAYAFVEWMRMVHIVFYYKEVPKERKVKLVALKLRKYSSN